MSFAETFCAKHQVHPAQYETTVLRLTLHRAARVLYPLLNLNPGYCAPDRGFIRSVGRISRIDDFRSEEHDFSHDPENRGLLHRTLKLRVSGRRMHDLVRAALRDSTSHE